MNCGLLGRKLAHSASPQLHALFGDYAYDLFERTEEQLPEFFRTCGLHGLNVTVPYKQTVLPYCDTLTDCARTVGSVNTLLFENGNILGDNTDVFGFQSLLAKYGIAVKRKKVLVLGSGGASKAVQYVLREQNADVIVISRTGENNYVNLNKHRDAAIIVNATPVGMYPENGSSPIDLTQFPVCKTVIDLIYNPLKTALLLQAETLGKQAVNGLFMLCAQAKRASELFQNRTLPDSLTETAYRTLSRDLQNVILIGMPGCGKTTAGELLAQKTGRPFFDSDAAFENTYGISPKDYLVQSCEPAFRGKETEILKELCKHTGCVIATGGGAVTVPENLPLLRQNGTTVFLDRDADTLCIQDRPLTQTQGIEALAKQRLPLYRDWADMTVRADSPEDAADTIRKELSL